MCLMKKNLWKYTLILLSASVVLVFLAAFSLQDDQLHLVFCDVGQGDAILIYQKSTQILVDGGPDSKVINCLSAHMPFWDREIEVVVSSHAESDHFIGFLNVVDRYQVDNFVYSGVGKESKGWEELSRKVKVRGIKQDILQKGGEIKFGDIQIFVLWPTQELVAGILQDPNSKVMGATTKESLNEYSLVLKLAYNDFTSLLTGDIEPPEEDIVAGVISGPISILKVPHHGSKNGLDTELLNATSPSLAVISVGSKNQFGHPHFETLSMLERNNIRVMRTDKDGEVEIVTDGRKWNVFK